MRMLFARLIGINCQWPLVESRACRFIVAEMMGKWRKCWELTLERRQSGGNVGNGLLSVGKCRECWELILERRQMQEMFGIDPERRQRAGNVGN